MTDLGGIGAFVKRGDRVLIKPNLLMSSPPDKAVVTHPGLVEAVAELIVDAGAKPFVGDSPPVGHLSRVLSKSGYADFMQRLGVEAVPFKEKMSCEFGEGRLYRQIELAREVFEFDVVVNLPKLKTHCQMFLTLSIKNLFGTVIGSDKAAWHMRAGRDYVTFATALVQIYEKVKPALNIVDGILAMEGDGPNNGTPRHVGILAGGADGTAVDAVICRLLGFEANELLTCVLSHELNVGTMDSAHIKVVGDELDGFPLSDFATPQAMGVRWNMGHRNPLRRFMEKHMVMRPRIDQAACWRCKVCLSHCPPAAISETDEIMTIDYNKCISCFCCHELCTSNAVHIYRPLVGRILSAITR
ncbi:MAG: DUF362 domain-containing protein [Pseudomonadota bacterium]